MTEKTLDWTVRDIGTVEEPPQSQVEKIVIDTLPVEETPIVVETPPVVTPEPIPATNEFNPIQMFGEGYDTVDKVKEALTAASELKGKVAEYEAKLKESTVQDPYIQSLIEWNKQGKSKETHDLVYYSDPSKLSLADKVALQLRLETGLSPEKAMKVVNHKYKLGEDYDAEDPEVDIARTMLEVDAKKAHDQIEQFRAKESAPTPTFDYAAQVSSWKPQIETTVNTLKELEIQPGMKYPVRAETIEAARAHIEGILLSDGVEMSAKDPEQQKVMQNIASDFIKAREMENILKFSHTEWEKSVIREKSNIPPVTPTTPTTPTTGKNEWMRTAKPFDM